MSEHEKSGQENSIALTLVETALSILALSYFFLPSQPPIITSAVVAFVLLFVTPGLIERIAKIFAYQPEKPVTTTFGLEGEIWDILIDGLPLSTPKKKVLRDGRTNIALLALALIIFSQPSTLTFTQLVVVGSIFGLYAIASAYFGYHRLNEYRTEEDNTNTNTHTKDHQSNSNQDT